MPGSPKKKIFKKREHSIAKWGGQPMELPWGVEPTDELLAERKAYLQTLLPDYLREGYVKEFERGEDKVRKKRHRSPNGPHVPKPMEVVAKQMYASAKWRAKKKGIPFDIELDDVVIPEFCPVLGIRLQTNPKAMNNSPNLDRLVPQLGYTKGNVCVISQRANRIKTDSTPEELEAVLSWVRSKLE